MAPYWTFWFLYTLNGRIEQGSTTDSIFNYICVRGDLHRRRLEPSSSQIIRNVCARGPEPKPRTHYSHITRTPNLELELFFQRIVPPFLPVIRCLKVLILLHPLRRKRFYKNRIKKLTDDLKTGIGSELYEQGNENCFFLNIFISWPNYNFLKKRTRVEQFVL